MDASRQTDTNHGPLLSAESFLPTYHSSSSHLGATCFTKMTSTLLPGQPIPVPRGPVPQLGGGTYQRDGRIRASIVGVPHFTASTLSIPRTRPNPPAPSSIILGTVTRLSPLQANVSITVVDGVPLPAGEEFNGVIRVQDVRATEKDKVKIADCFRGGDVVKGLVVRSTLAHSTAQHSILWCRFHSAMLVVITSLLLATIWESSLPQVKQVGVCSLYRAMADAPARRDNATRFLAGNEVPKDRQDRKTQVRKTRRHVDNVPSDCTSLSL